MLSVLACCLLDDNVATNYIRSLSSYLTAVPNISSTALPRLYGPQIVHSLISLLEIDLRHRRRPLAILSFYMLHECWDESWGMLPGSDLIGVRRARRSATRQLFFQMVMMMRKRRTGKSMSERSKTK
jgi:hypothetical protein